MGDQLERYPRGVQALSKATGIGPPRNTLMQKIADWLTEGTFGGEPGPVDLAIAFPNLPRKLITRSIPEALEAFRSVPRTRLGQSTENYFTDYVPGNEKVMDRIFRHENPYYEMTPDAQLTDPTELLPSQDYVSSRGVSDYIKNPPYDDPNLDQILKRGSMPRYLPEVLELPDGRKVLMDGHHRAAAAFLRGQPVPTYNYNVEEMIKLMMQDPAKARGRGVASLQQIVAQIKKEQRYRELKAAMDEMRGNR